jgi:hypothetical protein
VEGTQLLTTEDEGQILAGWHNLRATNQGAEESVHLFERHRFTVIQAVKEIIEVFNLVLGQGMTESMHRAILTLDEWHRLRIFEAISTRH